MSELKVSFSFHYKSHNLGIYNSCALICVELQFCNQLLQDVAINFSKMLQSLGVLQFFRLLSSRHETVRIQGWSSESTVLKAFSNTVTQNLCNRGSSWFCFQFIKKKLKIIKGAEYCLSKWKTCLCQVDAFQYVNLTDEW